MCFTVTREGDPIRQRRYVFTGLFATMALAAYADAAYDDWAAQEARDLFQRAIEHLTTPGLLTPKYNRDVRPMKSLAVPVTLLVTAQELRDALNASVGEGWIDQCIDEIREDFLDHFDGRLLNPGHATEGAWSVLREAHRRDKDEALVELGTTMLDWMWERGWDDEYGGIVYFRDVKNLPVQEYWHDMKFWWPQNEAIIATLLAYALTGDDTYANWHRKAHYWAYEHFPDPKFGEWYGYLHRDGSLSARMKGNV